MENLEEEKAIQDEIGDAISRAGMDFEDDDELLRELEELEEQQLEETLLQAPTPQSTRVQQRQGQREPEVLLPQAPTGGLRRPVVPQQEEEEDEDLEALRALEAEMMG